MGSQPTKEEKERERAKLKEEIDKQTKELEDAINEAWQKEQQKVAERAAVQYAMKMHSVQATELKEQMEVNKESLKNKEKVRDELKENLGKISGEIKEYESELQVKQEEYEESMYSIGSERTLMKRFETERNNKDVSLVIAIGPIGVGKSTFCNRFIGDESDWAEKGKFEVEMADEDEAPSLRSVTQEIKKQTTTYNGKKYTIVDTPGAHDNEQKDEINTEDLVRWLRGCGGVNGFLVFYDLSTMRISGPYGELLFKYQTILGKDAWEHVIIIATKADAYQLRFRKPKWDKLKAKINEEFYKKLMEEEAAKGGGDKDDNKNENNKDNDNNKAASGADEKAKEEEGAGSLNLPVLFVANNTNYKEKVSELISILSKDKYMCQAIKSKLEILEENKKQCKWEIDRLNKLILDRKSQLHSYEKELAIVQSKTKELKENNSKMQTQQDELQEKMFFDVVVYGLMTDRLDAVVAMLEDGKEDQDSGKSHENDDKFLCRCGTGFKYRKASTIYQGDGDVSCDVCREIVDKNAFVYHCPDGRSEAHRLGSDMCQDCANKQAAEPGASADQLVVARVGNV